MKKKYIEGFKITVGNSVFTLTERVNSVVWIATCSVCSRDNELFPYGSIRVSPSEMSVSGKLSCGCSKAPRLTERQNRVIVERECDKRGYKFINWVGKYEGVNKTKILIFDLQTNMEGTISSISSFLSGRDSLTRKEKAREAKLKSDDFYIAEFMQTGKYVDGTKFSRVAKVCNAGRYVYWKRFCPACFEDKYTKLGLCDGVFEGRYEAFKKGYLNCRCNPSAYSWTDIQNEVRLQELAEIENAKFLSWCPETSEKSQSQKKFIWMCEDGHINKTSVTNFVRGRRCSDPVCRYRNLAETNRFGFYDNRKNDIDFLYIIELSNNTERFIKIGRSFNLQERLTEIGRKYNVSVVAIHQGIHSEIFSLEQHLHASLRYYHYVPTIPFKGGINECFSVDCLCDESLFGYVNVTLIVIYLSLILSL